jgi:uncharacterized protein (DUF1330 family)
MKTYCTVALSMLAGLAVGAAAVQGLYAQAKPPVYTVAEIEMSNPDAYMKEFAPTAQVALKAGGSKLLAAGKATSIEGEPPKSRVTVRRYNSMDEAKAAYSSAEYKEARKIGDKYAKFRVFAVEGVQD